VSCVAGLLPELSIEAPGSVELGAFRLQTGQAIKTRLIAIKAHKRDAETY